MDPLSISASAFGIASGSLAIASIIGPWIQRVKDVNKDIVGFKNEVERLQTTSQLLGEHFGDSKFLNAVRAIEISSSTASSPLNHLETILNDCKSTVAKIKKMMVKLEGKGKMARYIGLERVIREFHLNMKTGEIKVLRQRLIHFEQSLQLTISIVGFRMNFTGHDATQQGLSTLTYRIDNLPAAVQHQISAMFDELNQRFEELAWNVSEARQEQSRGPIHPPSPPPIPKPPPTFELDAESTAKSDRPAELTGQLASNRGEVTDDTTTESEQGTPEETNPQAMAVEQTEVYAALHSQLQGVKSFITVVSSSSGLSSRSAATVRAPTIIEPDEYRQLITSDAGDYNAAKINTWLGIEPEEPYEYASTGSGSTAKYARAPLPASKSRKKSSFDFTRQLAQQSMRGIATAYDEKDYATCQKRIAQYMRKYRSYLDDEEGQSAPSLDLWQAYFAIELGQYDVAAKQLEDWHVNYAEKIDDLRIPTATRLLAYAYLELGPSKAEQAAECGREAVELYRNANGPQKTHEEMLCFLIVANALELNEETMDEGPLWRGMMEREYGVKATTTGVELMRLPSGDVLAPPGRRSPKSGSPPRSKTPSPPPQGDNLSPPSHYQTASSPRRRKVSSPLRQQEAPSPNSQSDEGASTANQWETQSRNRVLDLMRDEIDNPHDVPAKDADFARMMTDLTSVYREKIRFSLLLHVNEQCKQLSDADPRRHSNNNASVSFQPRPFKAQFQQTLCRIIELCDISNLEYQWRVSTRDKGPGLYEVFSGLYQYHVSVIISRDLVLAFTEQGWAVPVDRKARLRVEYELLLEHQDYYKKIADDKREDLWFQSLCTAYHHMTQALEERREEMAAIDDGSQPFTLPERVVKQTIEELKVDMNEHDQYRGDMAHALVWIRQNVTNALLSWVRDDSVRKYCLFDLAEPLMQIVRAAYSNSTPRQHIWSKRPLTFETRKVIRTAVAQLIRANMSRLSDNEAMEKYVKRIKQNAWTVQRLRVASRPRSELQAWALDTLLDLLGSLLAGTKGELTEQRGEDETKKTVDSLKRVVAQASPTDATEWYASLHSRDGTPLPDHDVLTPRHTIAFQLSAMSMSLLNIDRDPSLPSSWREVWEPELQKDVEWTREQLRLRAEPRLWLTAEQDILVAYKHAWKPLRTRLTDPSATAIVVLLLWVVDQRLKALLESMTELVRRFDEDSSSDAEGEQQHRDIEPAEARTSKDEDQGSTAESSVMERSSRMTKTKHDHQDTAAIEDGAGRQAGDSVSSPASSVIQNPALPAPHAIENSSAETVRRWWSGLRLFSDDAPVSQNCPSFTEAFKELIFMAHNNQPLIPKFSLSANGDTIRIAIEKDLRASRKINALRKNDAFGFPLNDRSILHDAQMTCVDVLRQGITSLRAEWVLRGFCNVAEDMLSSPLRWEVDTGNLHARETEAPASNDPDLYSADIPTFPVMPKYQGDEASAGKAGSTSAHEPSTIAVSDLNLPSASATSGTQAPTSLNEHKRFEPREPDFNREATAIEAAERWWKGLRMPNGAYASSQCSLVFTRAVGVLVLMGQQFTLDNVQSESISISGPSTNSQEVHTAVAAAISRDFEFSRRSDTSFTSQSRSPTRVFSDEELMHERKLLTKAISSYAILRARIVTSDGRSQWILKSFCSVAREENDARAAEINRRRMSPTRPSRPPFLTSHIQSDLTSSRHPASSLASVPLGAVNSDSASGQTLKDQVGNTSATLTSINPIPIPDLPLSSNQSETQSSLSTLSLAGIESFKSRITTMNVMCQKDPKQIEIQVRETMIFMATYTPQCSNILGRRGSVTKHHQDMRTHFADYLRIQLRARPEMSSGTAETGPLSLLHLLALATDIDGSSHVRFLMTDDAGPFRLNWTTISMRFNFANVMAAEDSENADQRQRSIVTPEKLIAYKDLGSISAFELAIIMNRHAITHALLTGESLKSTRSERYEGFKRVLHLAIDLERKSLLTVFSKVLAQEAPDGTRWIDHMGRQDENLLYFAIRNQCLAMIEYLISQGAVVNKLIGLWSSPVHYALQQALLKFPGKHILAGSVALYPLSLDQKPQSIRIEVAIIKALLGAGADPNFRMFTNYHLTDDTSLFPIALVHRRADICCELLDKGCHVDPLLGLRKEYAESETKTLRSFMSRGSRQPRVAVAILSVLHWAVITRNEALLRKLATRWKYQTYVLRRCEGLTPFELECYLHPRTSSVFSYASILQENGLVEPALGFLSKPWASNVPRPLVPTTASVKYLPKNADGSPKGLWD